MAKQKYYVVWKGRRTGVFDNWAECAAQVTGYPGAEYMSFDNLPTAEKAFRGTYSQYHGKTPASPVQRKMALTRPLTPSLSVDAACSGVPGPVEWRGVETASGKQVFKFGPYPDGTNNVGEFLAIVAGLKWLKDNRLNWPLYSDSRNAKLWVEAKRSRSKLARTGRNAELFELVSSAESWLAQNSFSNEVLKWDTGMWGENPADFGRKS